MRCFVPAADVAARQAETEAWAEFLLLCPDWFTEAEIPGLVQGDIERRHQVRIATLPGAVAAIGSDASLLLPDTDSDADSLSNTAEINVPLVEASLPWLVDSDLDGIIDSSDDCPADPLNLCSSNPLLPVLTVGFDVFVSEPESGSGVVIISIVLNRSVDMPVTVEYRAFIDVGDTAEGATDFLEVSGSVTIPAGERVALITVPIFGDLDSESPETFTIEITGVTNATLGDDGQVVVTINNTEPGANNAPAFTSGNANSVVEGNTATGYTATATDADGDILTFIVNGGADQSAFNIDAASGALAFASAPAFATPGDANSDNVYEVQLQVSDNRGGFDTLDIAVTVTEAGLVIEVTFPTPGANLGGNVTNTMVAGNILDSAGMPLDHSDISFIDINGVLATRDLANPGRWFATVPVSAGDNTLVIETQSTGGQAANIDLELQNFVIHTNFQKLDVDASGNRALVAESLARAVVSVDLASGERTTLSGVGTGSGTAFNSPRDVAFDLANNRALVVDWQLDALIAVDLASGNRTILSNNSTGSGTALDGAHAVTLDSANNLAYVVATIDNNVIAVDLTTGDRSLVSGSGVGSGAEFGSLRDLELDSSSNRLLVLDSGFGIDGLLEVDLTSGDRNTISDATTGTGPALRSPDSLVFDSGSNRVLVADLTGALVSVDVATGNRTIVSDFTADFGINANNLIGVGLDPAANRAIVADHGLDTIFAIDLSSAIRSVISDSATGTSNIEASLSPHTSGIEFDLTRNRVLVLASPAVDRLLSVDLAGGDRSVVSGDPVGSGPALVFARKFTIDASNNRAVIPDASANAIYLVDLDSGDRTIVSSNASVGSGPLFGQPTDVAVDLPNDRILVMDVTAGLIAVDLANGNRSVISNAATGAGPLLSQPSGVALDEDGNRVIVADYGLPAIIAINLATGDRNVISDNTGIGSGTNFFVPYDISFEKEANRVLVVDYGVDILMAVDLDTGDRTSVSSNVVGTGINFINPELIALDKANNRAFVYDIAVTALMVVDLSTGQRAVVSK
jgi:hypothetical protein